MAKKKEKPSGRGKKSVPAARTKTKGKPTSKAKVTARAKAQTRSKPRSGARASTKAPASAKKVVGSPAKRAGGRKSGPLGIGTLHVDFLTYKSTQIQKFYGDFLELKTEFQDIDGVDYLLVRTSSSSSVGFMPPHPDMRGEQPAPREPALYFMVEDVDRAYQYLLDKGAAFVRPPETMPWGHRVLVTTDPEGRTVMIAGKASSED